MQSNQIKYQIQSSRIIKGQGNIDDIKNTILNRCFSLYSDADQHFDINLRLESPSIITKINMNLMNTHSYTLKLSNNKNNIVEQFSQTINSRKQQITIIPTVLTQPIRYVHLRISNNKYNSKRLGIRYVILNGINDQIKNKKQNKKESNSKENKNYNKDNHQLFQTQKKSIRKDPKSLESKDIFNKRSKQKSSAQKIAKLIDFTAFDNQMRLRNRQRESQQKSQNNIKRKVKYNQDNNFMQQTRKSYLNEKKLKEQTDLAIALSKSQQTHQRNYQKMEIENGYQKIQIEKSLPAAFQDYINQNFQVLPQRTYQTVQFNEQYISSFSDLSPAWLKAQRLAQESYNVRQDEKLSKYIRLKHLYDQQIFIDGFQNWKMDQIKHRANDLGCKIINQLKNHCMAIVSKPLCQKLCKKHKQWKQIKYLTPNYLQDCMKQQQKLNPKDYYIRI